MNLSPIILAPMANISTATIVAEVCEAGGLGMIGSALMPANVIEAQVAAVRAKTARPFGLNFFCHEPLRHLEVVLGLRPAFVSFHFGLPDEAVMRALRDAGVTVISTATTVGEARELEARGADVIIAQGVEAGGHRGMFSATLDEQTSTMALVPRVVDAVKVPVIAAGGIMDGRGVRAVLALGATAAQLGTAFLGCPEAEIDPAYRKALFEPQAARTRITKLLSGKPARAIVTPWLDEEAANEDKTAPFPQQRMISAPHTPAMWAGQGAPLTRALPARELVAALAREAGLQLA
jgi:nitronate monooxygenase